MKFGRKIFFTRGLYKGSGILVGHYRDLPDGFRKMTRKANWQLHIGLESYGCRGKLVWTPTISDPDVTFRFLFGLFSEVANDS